MLPAALETLLFQAGALLAQAAAAGGDAGKGNLTIVPGPEHKAEFQPYIFFAYGLACGFLLLFTLWTHLETRSLAGRIEYLKERFRLAHPGALDGE